MKQANRSFDVSFAIPSAASSLSSRSPVCATDERRPRSSRPSSPVPQRTGPTPGMVAGVPLFVALTAIQQGLRALLGSARPAQTSEPPSCRDQEKSKRSVSGALRDIADGVDADLEELRAGLRRETRRREAAEAAENAAKDELEDLRRCAREEFEDAVGTMPETAKLLFANMTRAQIRAAAGERNAKQMREELEAMRGSLTVAKGDVVLANAMWFVLTLALLTFMTHTSPDDNGARAWLKGLTGI